MTCWAAARKEERWPTGACSSGCVKGNPGYTIVTSRQIGSQCKMRKQLKIVSAISYQEITVLDTHLLVPVTTGRVQKNHSISVKLCYTGQGQDL